MSNFTDMFYSDQTQDSFKDIGFDEFTSKRHSMQGTGNKRQSFDREVKQLRVKNSHLEQAVLGLQDKFKMIPIDFADYGELVRENSLLKNEKDSYLNQIKKNEELLFKAHNLIKFLRKDESEQPEKLKKSSDKYRSLNNSFVHGTPIHSQTAGKEKELETVLDLQDKLYRANKNLQETLMRLNSADSRNKELNEKSLRLERDMLNLQAQNEKLKAQLNLAKQKMKNYERELGEAQRATKSIDVSGYLFEEKNDLEKKLAKTIQYNEELFQNYSSILKLNSDLQNRLQQFENENNFLKEELRDLRDNTSIIKETESKMDNIEHNLSKIEETSMAIPDIERKITKLKKDQKSKMDLLNICAEYLEAQFSKTSSCLMRALKADRACPISRTEVTFTPLEEIARKTKHKDVQSIIERIDCSGYIQIILENIVGFALNKAKSSCLNAFAEKRGIMEKRFERLETSVQKLKTLVRQKEKLYQNQSLALLKEKKSIHNISVNNFSVRKSFSFDKEYEDEDKENLCYYNSALQEKVRDDEESLITRLVEFLENYIGKLTEYSDFFGKLQTKLDSVTCLPIFSKKQNPPDASKDETRLLLKNSINICKELEVMDLYMKKEITAIKQELIYRMKGSKLSKIL